MAGIMKRWAGVAAVLSGVTFAGGLARGQDLGRDLGQIRRDQWQAQRDAWQTMAQARIQPVPESATSRWPWQRSAA